MKKRLDYVTNSSSSSFIINKRYLTDEQLDMIRNYKETAELLGVGDVSDEWILSEDWNSIYGFTMMDNFEMMDFLRLIGIPDYRIEWEN